MEGSGPCSSDRKLHRKNDTAAAVAFGGYDSPWRQQLQGNRGMGRAERGDKNALKLVVVVAQHWEYAKITVHFKIV